MENDLFLSQLLQKFGGGNNSIGGLDNLTLHKPNQGYNPTPSALRTKSILNKDEDGEGGDFLSSIFGDKGMLQGIGSTLGGLGNLYLGYQSLKNAKKQQAFSNSAMTHQMNTQTKMMNDQYDQRSQSHAASKGLQGKDREQYVNEQNQKSQLPEFRR